MLKNLLLDLVLQLKLHSIWNVYSNIEFNTFNTFSCDFCLVRPFCLAFCSLLCVSIVAPFVPQSNARLCMVFYAQNKRSWEANAWKESYRDGGQRHGAATRESEILRARRRRERACRLERDRERARRRREREVRIPCTVAFSTGPRVSLARKLCGLWWVAAKSYVIRRQHAGCAPRSHTTWFSTALGAGVILVDSDNFKQGNCNYKSRLETGPRCIFNFQNYIDITTQYIS